MDRRSFFRNGLALFAGGGMPAGAVTGESAGTPRALPYRLVALDRAVEP